MPEVTVGVDTHLDTNVAVALDEHGRVLGNVVVPTTSPGHKKLLAWARAFGTLKVVGVEGTGSYGAGLTRYLATIGVRVVEVDRPNRQARRTRGRTGLVDAEIAARAVLSGSCRTQPKTASGHVESLRMLRVARRSAMRARTQAANQLHSLVVTAPDDVRSQTRDLSAIRLVRLACAWRTSSASNPSAAAKFTMRSVARRYRALTAEVGLLDAEIADIVGQVAPDLLSLQNVGPETASALLVAAGDNPERLRSESSFAHMCGVAPLPASSGKSHRHRLNRGGNREANCALYTIAVGRLYRDERTAVYAARRTAEGLSRREIIRCLKRFIARDIYHVILPAMRPVVAVGAGQL